MSLFQDVNHLRHSLRLLRRGLIRMGEVKEVDVTACTVVIEYDDLEDGGSAVLSDAIPWFQRGTEHRPPVVGDHVIVIDPSLGMGSAIALTGWPSDAVPAPEAGERHVILKQYGSLIKVDDNGTCTLNNCTVDVDGNTQIPETLDVTKETTIQGATTISNTLDVMIGGPQIQASASGVNLSGGADFVALAQKVDLNFTVLKSILTTAFTSVGAGIAANGALGAVQMASFVPVPTGALKVKAT